MSTGSGRVLLAQWARQGGSKGDKAGQWTESNENTSSEMQPKHS